MHRDQRQREQQFFFGELEHARSPALDHDRVDALRDAIIMTVIATMLAGLASSEMTKAQYDAYVKGL